MTSRELNLAIAVASKLPRPAQRVPQTKRRNREALPRNVYRGYKGRFVAIVWDGTRNRYLGTFPTVGAAEEAVAASH